MKKFNPLLTVLTMLMMASSVVFAETYTVTPIPKGGDFGFFFDIKLKDKGVVWEDVIDGYKQVFFYDGNDTTQITFDETHKEGADVNSEGKMVWQDSVSRQIFLYDGTDITPIADGYPTGIPHPSINDEGKILWQVSNGTHYDIYLYDGAGVSKIADNSYLSAKINCSGYIVWAGDDGHDTDIFLFDGTSVTNISNSDYNDTNPVINNEGQIVWQGYDGGSDLEIFLFDGTGITQITDNDFNDNLPQINSGGKITWQGYDSGSDLEIFFFDGMGTTQITDNEIEDRSPQINSQDKIVWYAHDGNDSEVFLYDRAGITQFTDNDKEDVSPAINSMGLILWTTINTEGLTAYIATPYLEIDDILNFFYDAVEAGTITGTGHCRSADRHLYALLSILEEAKSLIAMDDSEGACANLSRAYLHSDGNPHPKDLVTGSAVTELSDQILELSGTLGCTPPAEYTKKDKKSKHPSRKAKHCNASKGHKHK